MNAVAGKGRLRAALSRSHIVLVPGAFDALSARVIERCGFDAVYVTGAGFANASFGLPDVGLVSATEALANAQRICDAVTVPVIVDADNGYGGVLNVARTVRQLEHAGAAAIQLEDQVAPKRCGHFKGTEVIPASEMLQKIAAALDAREDPDLVLIARTDARRTLGVEEAVARANAYLAAGADIAFVEAPQTMDELRALPRLVHGPLLANMVEGGRTPLLSARELDTLGYRIALFANTALRTAVKAVSSAMRVLHEDGSPLALIDGMISWEERQDLVGLPEMEALESRYLQNASRPA